MQARDRVLTALSHRESDRVPVDYWAGPEVGARLMGDLGCATHEELLRRLGVDLRYVAGPSYAGQEFGAFEDGTVSDLWGVRRRTVEVTRGPYRWSYRHATVSPLADATSVAEIDGYGHWPSPDWWDYSTLAADCASHPGFAVVNAGDRMDRTAQLKPMMYLRGMEQTYVDLAWNPELVDAIVGHVREYFLEYNRRVFEAAGDVIDIFMMGDDFGTQTGPMMSLETWRRFFRDGFRRYIELAHQYGTKVMHHTCGSVVELIPDFIDCGLDVLQSLQPRAAGMDLAAIKREFGRDLCFHGGVDIQGRLVDGTPEDISEMVRRTLDAGKPGGGCVLCTAHNIPPETPSENIEALFAACREMGGY